MKKLIFLVLFLILTSPLCFSLSDFHFSVAPRVSLTYGELNEILYEDDNEIISQLDWEQKPLLDTGLVTELCFDNFIFSAAFDYSFPLGTSHMYDSDWEDGEKYGMTKHPIKKSQNINSELSGAYKFQITRKLGVIPQIQLQYLYNDFEADIGSGYRRERNIRVYGIDYKRHSFFIFTGLALQTKINPKFSLTAEFFTAPWNYQYCFDHHHGVKHPFSTEETQHGFFTKYKTGISANIIFTDWLSLKCFSTLLFGFSDKGSLNSDYYTRDTMEPILTEKSGSSLYFIKIGTALTFTF